MGQGAGHADNACFGRHIDGHTGRGDHPTDGAHVDDGAAACQAHGGDDALRHKELLPEVDGNGPVPQLGGDVFDGVARVVAGVVDQDIDGAEPAEDLLDGSLQFCDVGKIAAYEQGLVPAFGADPVDQL